MIGRERRLHASSNTITSISEYSSVGGVSATPAQAQDVDIFYESKAEPRELWEINDDVVTYKDCEPFSPNPNGHGNGKRRRSGAKQKDEKYDLFLSHLQRNGQDAVIAMQMFLQQAHPGIRIFIDLDVDMKGDLTGTLEEGVKNCGAFLFFITDGILKSEWCCRELRWAVQYEKRIVLVRETDERHGGMEMNAFLQQVPQDLLHVFKNNIAIPWYRQPAFRSVSVKSIIQASQIEDAYTKDIKRLLKAKTALLESYKGTSNPTTCVEIIEEASVAMRVVFFFGGFTSFKNRTINRIYTWVFSICFWTCGSLCFLNLIYQTVPYHIISTDALTAYVHLPAWQSWWRWRKFVHSKGCDELLSKVSAGEGAMTTIIAATRATGWLVLGVQVIMVLDVLLGFSLPYTLELGGEPGKEFGNNLPGAKEFTMWHAWVMWPLIPAVIASMFASYSMFGFVALLHLLDIRNVQKTVKESMGTLSNFYKSKASPYKATEILVKKREAGNGLNSHNGLTSHALPKQSSVRSSAAERSDQLKSAIKIQATVTRDRSENFDENDDDLSIADQIHEAISPTHSLRSAKSGENTLDRRISLDQEVSGKESEIIVEDLQAQLRKVAMEELLFKTVCELLLHLFKRTQQRMDHTCKALSSLWLHLVFFSTCQVLAISQAFTGHANGLLTVKYQWWYALQDIFHLGGGLVLLGAAMGVFCVVTSYFKAVRLDTMEVLVQAGCPAPRQAAVMGLLAARPLGMHVIRGSTYMDVPKAVGFTSVISAIILNNAIQVFNGLDY